jgi:hypothetical protein
MYFAPGKCRLQRSLEARSELEAGKKNGLFGKISQRPPGGFRDWRGVAPKQYKPRLAEMGARQMNFWLNEGAAIDIEAYGE